MARGDSQQNSKKTWTHSLTMADNLISLDGVEVVKQVPTQAPVEKPAADKTSDLSSFDPLAAASAASRSGAAATQGLGLPAAIEAAFAGGESSTKQPIGAETKGWEVDFKEKMRQDAEKMRVDDPFAGL